MAGRFLFKRRINSFVALVSDFHGDTAEMKIFLFALRLAQADHFPAHVKTKIFFLILKNSGKIFLYVLISKIYLV